MLIPLLWQRGIKVTGTSVTAEDMLAGVGYPEPPALFHRAQIWGPTSVPLTPRLPWGNRSPLRSRCPCSVPVYLLPLTLNSFRSPPAPPPPPSPSLRSLWVAGVTGNP